MPVTKVDNLKFAMTIQAMVHANKNVSIPAIARATGLSEGAVYYKMNRLGITRDINWNIPADIFERARA